MLQTNTFCVFRQSVRLALHGQTAEDVSSFYFADQVVNDLTVPTLPLRLILRLTVLADTCNVH